MVYSPWGEKIISLNGYLNLNKQAQIHIDRKNLFKRLIEAVEGVKSISLNNII